MIIAKLAKDSFEKPYFGWGLLVKLLNTQNDLTQLNNLYIIPRCFYRLQLLLGVLLRNPSSWSGDAAGKIAPTLYVHVVDLNKSLRENTSSITSSLSLPAPAASWTSKMAHNVSMAALRRAKGPRWDHRYPAKIRNLSVLGNSWRGSKKEYPSRIRRRRARNRVLSSVHSLPCQ